MSQESSDLRRPFILWLVANILGFGASGAAYFVIPAKILMSGIVASTLIIALPIGLAQWIALRWILNTSRLWIFTVLVGLPLALLIINNIPDTFLQFADDESVAALTAGYLVIGFSVGLPQWLILRRQVSRSSFWLLGSSIGAAAGVWLILITEWINLSAVLSFVVAVLTYSIVTGLTLTRLLAYPNRFQANLTSAS